MTVKPVECEGHQQSHDEDKHLQEAAPDVVGVIVPIQTNL